MYLSENQKMKLGAPYLSLDHSAALSPQFQDALVDIDASLSLQNLQHDVQDNESPSPPHPCTAVNEQGRRVRGEVRLADVPDEPQESCGIARNTVVGPGLEVVVDYVPLLFSL